MNVIGNSAAEVVLREVKVLEPGTVIDSFRELGGDQVIERKINGCEVLEVTDVGGDCSRYVQVLEGYLGDGTTGAGDFWPRTVGGVV